MECLHYTDRTAVATLDIPFLERRRRLALRFAVGTLVVALVAFPIAMAINGRSETADTVSGAFLMASIACLIASPSIVRTWQGFMRRRMVAAAVAGRSDIRHIDGEHAGRDAQAALSSDAFALGAFRDCGLVEAFESATVQHVLTGTADGVAFAVAELALLDAKRYRMFGGVLASFRLHRPRTGLTVVTRDRGVVGNMLARAGSGGVESIALEDPQFEHLFEVYGDDQVQARVILTPRMLETLRALDTLAQARGFACAFRGEHLLVAFDGMSWRCPAWRILQPLDAWLRTYSAWLMGLVDLPRGIVATLDLDAPDLGIAFVPFTPEPRAAVAIDTGAPEIFSSSLWRLAGEGGMAATYLMSGAMFGGLAAFAANYGVREGFPARMFWSLWTMTGLGLAYGTYAIALGVGQLARLAWKWKSPLRTMDRRPRR